MNLRKRAKLTQQQLADQLGVAYKTVQNWESGRHECKLTAIEWLALMRLLGCTPEELAEAFPQENTPTGNA